MLWAVLLMPVNNKTKFDKILGTTAQQDISLNSQISLKDIDHSIKF